MGDHGTPSKGITTIKPIAKPAPVAQAVTEEVVPTEQQIGAVASDGGTEVFNRSLLPMELQKIIDDGYAETNRQRWRIPNQSNMEQLGLNVNEEADRRLYADLTGVVAENLSVNIERHIKDVTPTSITIENYVQRKDSLSPAGFGYMQTARQLAAARELSRRTGKDVVIYTKALSYGRAWVGVHVWPKLGYIFPIPKVFKERLREMGFTPRQTRTTATLMLSRTSDGKTGYDAWDELMKPQTGEIRLRGDTKIRFRDVQEGRLSLAERVTRSYGKRKGFVKSATPTNDEFTAEDNATLRDIWLGMKG